MEDKCKCYHTMTQTRFSSDAINHIVVNNIEISTCWGTRERDVCYCGGDRTRCDFYPEVRERAKKELKKVVTNGDNIRSMTNEKLAEFLDELVHTGACNDFGIIPERECDSNCVECIKEWLQQSVKE